MLYNYFINVQKKEVGAGMTKTTGRRSFILVFFAIAILVISLGIFAWLSVDSNEKQIQLDAINAQLEQINQDNQKMDNLINNADKAELYEHLAREHGYAYPDEKIFYDVTPGN